MGRATFGPLTQEIKETRMRERADEVRVSPLVAGA